MKIAPKSLGKAFVDKAWKPVTNIWSSGDLSKRITVGLGLASMALTPLGALGVYASETIQTDKGQLKPESFKGRTFVAAAQIYPVIWTLVQSISAGQTIIAASLISILGAVLTALSSLYYDSLLYERLNQKLRKKEAKEVDDQAQQMQLGQKLNHTSSLLNFYTKAIFIGLLSWYGEFSALPDLSKDINSRNPLQIKPVDSQEILLKGKNYWQRVKFNFGQEIKATLQTLDHAFKPSKWRGTLWKQNEFVENYIKSEGLKPRQAWLTRIGSSAMPSAFACFAAFGRLLCGLLFISVLPVLGVEAFSDQKKSKEQKEYEHKQHPYAWTAYNAAEFLKSLVLWSSGLMSILMGFSLAYKDFAGNTASKLQAAAGLLTISAGSTGGPNSRLLTFLSSMALTFANGLRNLIGASK